MTNLKKMVNKTGSERVISPVAKLLARIILVIVIFGVAEMLVRIFDLEPKPLKPLPVRGYRLSENPVLRYEYRPNYNAADDPSNTSELHYGVGALSINKNGFRDYVYSREKPKDVFRIIALGDSTTKGNNIPNIDDLYTKLLEKRLNKDNTKIRYDVLNMGVGGYHTMQEVETLKTKGLQYNPDIVFILFCTNDFDMYNDGWVYKALVGRNSPSIISTKFLFSQFLLSKSRLLFIGYYRINSLLMQYGIKKDGLYEKMIEDQWYEKNVLKGKTTVEAGLKELSQLQRKHQFSAFVFILPSFTHNFDRYRQKDIHSRVFQIAKSFPNIKVIDLLGDFQKVNNDASVFTRDGAHKNEYGHKVLSEILFRELTPVIKSKNANLYGS